MLGAIAGDIIGSVFEARPVKHKQFDLFGPGSTYTDDTVLTLAIADALLTGGDFAGALRRYFRMYPGRGYGAGFARWAALENTGAPYYSYGNGSAMRVSPVAWASTSLQEARTLARQSAAVSHNHVHGLTGAEAVASAVFLARGRHSKTFIRTYLEMEFGYDLGRRLDEIRPEYSFDITCQGSVPESIIAFLESSDYEDAVRNAISLGGDADTMACMAGAIAEAYYGGVPATIRSEALARLPTGLRSVLQRFSAAIRCPVQTAVTSRGRGRKTAG
jgi:ADP-ribosylglycohydrolase